MARFQRTGDAEAFGEVAARCLPSSMAAARRILGDASLAEDAVQEAFLRVVRNRQRYVPSKPFSCWFHAIVRNICLDMMRRLARQVRLAREMAARSAAADRAAGDASAVPDLLAALPKGERDVLILRIVHDLPFRDVGAALGITEEAAKKRAQRGLRRLRRQRHVLEALGAAAVDSAVAG